MPRSRQLSLFVAKRKPRGRKKPGPKPLAERAGFMPHRTRAEHSDRCPVHVTIRRVPLAPSFRTDLVRGVILAQLAWARRKQVRVVHFSIQDDHLHLMIEGFDRVDLSNQMRKLFSRIAMSINAVVGRHGKLFRDRHHRHELKTPREVRNALVYIFFNARRHAGRNGLTQRVTYEWLDDFTSAPWFTSWHEKAHPSPEAIASLRARLGQAPTSPAGTWLAQVGWQRPSGRIRIDELPRIPPARR